MDADENDEYDKKYDSSVQENPYELQAAMEQQLRLEQNGSMEHAVTIVIVIVDADIVVAIMLQL